MGDSIANVYSDARSEYTKQLCGILIPSYFQFYLSILEKARAEATKTNDPKKLLWHFQTFLNEIPDWNMEKVNMESGLIQSGCGCDYLEDLLTAVFIAHTKVLTAIRVSGKQKKVQITVPKVEHFLFKVLCETSKLLWGSSFLFRENITAIEKQQNYRSVEALLGEGILQAVRSMVPVKNILRDFVSMDDDEDTPKVEEETPKVEEIPKVEETPKSKEEIVKVEEPVALIDLSGAIQPISTPSETPPSETVSDLSGGAPIINLSKGEHRVGFADYNSMFDADEHGTDMVKSLEEQEGGGLEILEEQGTPLTMDDIQDIDALDGKDEAIKDEDYDVLE
uniref:Uncharacterized protein n=1 Tax=viral metagenome TaxID=1070528 RepID=A0A6C0K2F8_9ZZZZ